jgi:hypothetical protein
MASPAADEAGDSSGSAQWAASRPSKRLLMKPAQRLAMLTTLPTRSLLTRCGEVLEVEVEVVDPEVSLAAK